MRKVFLIPFLLLLFSCQPSRVVEEKPGDEDDPVETIIKKELTFKIDDVEYGVNWSDNLSTKSLINSITNVLIINMHIYNDVCQMGEIGKTISSDNKDVSVDYGDIVLYESNKIAIFYDSYNLKCTKLGHLPLRKMEIEELLSEKDVTVTLGVKINSN